MNIYIKHKYTSDNYYRITIIPNQYRCTLSLIDEMFEIAIKDFPFVNKSNVEVVQQGGDYCRKMYALEFEVPINCDIPEDYIESKINPTLS